MAHHARNPGHRDAHDTRNSEWQATGLGPWAKDPISENAIRSQMGKPLRPEYGLRTYD